MMPGSLKYLLENNNHYINYGYDKFYTYRDNGTDKERTHFYITDFYEEHFLPYKNLPIKLLEIGIASGSSLQLWHDYFSKALIYGVDVHDVILPHIDKLKRVARFIADAYSYEFLSTLPNFDIIIDDGPHTYNSYHDLLTCYLPKVNKGGILTIEDIPDVNFINSLLPLIQQFQYQILDTREKYNKTDNLLLAVFK